MAGHKKKESKLKPSAVVMDRARAAGKPAFPDAAPLFDQVTPPKRKKKKSTHKPMSRHRRTRS